VRDFKIIQYKALLKTLIEKSYYFITVTQFISKTLDTPNLIILRHDIDRPSKYILHFAEFENQCGIKATYYFPSKIIRKYPELIKKIAAFGHEIGYHYNDLSNNQGDFLKAIESFKKNLSLLREFSPVTSICMDGKPYHKYDNRKLWDHYNYKDFGILAEIYKDIDYNEFAYYTDTGRKWNNKKINVRDKVVTTKNWPIYKSTFEMIKALENGSFPEKVVINIHPEHWMDSYFDWTKKLFWQSVKNVGKFLLIKTRNLQWRIREGKKG
jgi:hypothetical protein